MWRDKVCSSSSSADRDLEFKLNEALNSGNKLAFKRLIKGGVDVNAKFRSNSSLLHEAVMSGKVDLAEVLLQNKADVNKMNDYGRTALHLACRRGLLTCVQLLVKYGASVDLQSTGGQTALHIAVWRGKKDAPELVKSLVEGGANVNLTDVDGWLPIHWAAKLNYISVVKFLIEHGSLIDVKSQKGSPQTPFIQALTNSNVDLARLLLVHGAEVNSCNSAGMSSAEIVLNDKDLPDSKKVKFVHFLFQCGFKAKGEAWTRLKRLIDKLTNQNGGTYSLLDSSNLDQSLAGLCRTRIRSHVKLKTKGRSIVADLRKLCLPKLLIDFVTFSDELTNIIRK